MTRADMDRDNDKPGTPREKLEHMTRAIAQMKVIGHLEGMCCAMDQVQALSTLEGVDLETLRKAYKVIRDEADRIHAKANRSP